MTFRQRLKEAVAVIGRAKFMELTKVPPSTLSIWLISDVQPSLERLKSLQEATRCDFGVTSLTPKEEAAINITAQEAAKLLGCSVEFIHRGLQQRVFPWGDAVKNDEHWSYFINGPKLRRLECLN